MRRRRGGFWRLRRSMTGAPAPTQRGSGMSGCRRCATGCGASTPGVRRGCSTARPRATGPSSMTRSVGPWPRSSSAGRSRPSTRWCSGGWPISRIGSGRSSASRSARPGGSRTAGVGVSQDLRASAPLRAERTGHRRLQKKGFPAALDAIRAGLPAGTEIELWCQDEARVGQKNSITRRGPSAARDPAPRMTSERNGRTSSARSARRRARAPRWSCLGATCRRWPPTCPKSARPSMPAPTRF